MEPTLIAGLVLLVISEVLPYTPLKGNGLIELIVGALRDVFPHKSSDS